MILSGLKKYFVRRAVSAHLVRPSVALPNEVLELVAGGQGNRLAAYIENVCAQENSEDILEEIGSRIQEANWDAGEQTKVAAYSAYFSGRYQQAYDLALPQLQDDVFDPDFFGVASMSLYNANQFDEAYRLLRAIKPHEHLLLANPDYQLAAVLISWSAGDRYLANKYMDLGMRTVASKGVMTFNAFAVYWELGDWEGYALSESYLDDELRARPNFQYSLAFVELMKDNYEDGLRMAESRYEMPEAQRYMKKGLLKIPRWHGEDISNKVLLIHGEQGLGDMIQTARFFGVAQAAAKSVIVDCPNESIALLEHNFPGITFVPLNLTKELEQHFDIWTGTLSLPYVFKMGSKALPGRQGYLKVPSDHLSYWSKRVAELARRGAARIGIAWSGYPGHRGDRRRSIPWPMARTMIEQFPDVDFFAVQIKVPDDAPANLHNCSEEMATLSDTAALIEQMDLIISVDTSVVHIAGAIGKETWMMLPYRYEWRWGIEGEDNNWYDSVKVIRQPSPGAWAPVLSRVFGRRLRGFIELRIGKTYA